MSFLAQCLVLDLIDKCEFSISVERLVRFTEVFAHTEGALYTVDIFPIVHYIFIISLQL